MQHFSFEIANQRISEMIKATEQESIARRFESSLRERLATTLGGGRRNIRLGGTAPLASVLR